MMWMQLGSRAFVTGAQKRRQRREDEQLRSFQDEEISGSGQVNVKTLIHDSVFLTNPSMNELMGTLHSASASAVEDLKGVVIMGSRQAALESSQEEDLDLVMDRDRKHLAIVSIVNRVQRPKNPRMGNVYWNFSSELPKRTSPHPLHRTLSVDEFPGLQGNANDGILGRVHSEGALTTRPGIDCTLSEQMAVLKPVCEQMLRQSGDQGPPFSNLDLVELRKCGKRERRSVGGEQIEVITGSDYIDGPQPQEIQGLCHWIDLAHLLLVIACLRGLL